MCHWAEVQCQSEALARLIWLSKDPRQTCNMATTPPPTASAGAAVATSAGGTSACGSSSVADSIRDTLKTQGGVLFAKQCIVHRVTYSGRDIIAPNSAFSADKVDERGYVPVERWILSKTVSHMCPLQSLVFTLQTPTACTR